MSTSPRLQMEPALEVLAQALQGDADARAFLDRTASIYVLDVASDPAQPKLYGCWNFLHQALNEVQRLESAAAAASRSNETTMLPSPLTMHVRLLASLALRVARRSIRADQKLVGICLSNAAKYSATQNESEHLVSLNTNLRDIVLGRIAALTFDSSAPIRRHRSAFADPVVGDAFAGVLAANAASNGPASVQHLLQDWIIPSASTLPPRAVGRVVTGLAVAARDGKAPAGTQETLQTLSASVVGGILGPLWQRAVKQGDDDLTTVAVQAFEQWCLATDLSLAQIKHVCTKVDIDVVEILSDTMYSSSGAVLDAMADFVEYAVLSHDMTEARMTQVRLLMQVDEVAFRGNVRPEQLLHIDRKELATILDELQSAIGLQRSRFLQRQEDGDYDVCRSLTRIAAATCTLHMSNTPNEPALAPETRPGTGVLDLLLKAASHPSIHICALAVEALSALVPRQVGLSLQLLPVLQRRAITPHEFEDDNVPTLDENFDTFTNFREACLRHALVLCYRDSRESFMSSCTSAVEEFCDRSAGIDVSFHLEAALYCLSAVAEESRQQDHSAHLKRCTVSLSAKPVSSMMRNPLTLRQVCRFLSQYDRWYCEAPEALAKATDLALTTFSLSSTNFSEEPICVAMKRDGNVSPFSDAAMALRGLLSLAPQHFLSNPAIAALGAAWESSYTASNRPGVLTIEDRQALCIGICHVLAALPESQRGKSLQALAMPSLDCLNTMVRMALSDTNNSETTKAIHIRISHEILVLKTMVRTFTDAYGALSSSGCRTSDDRAPLAPPALAIAQQAMPSISIIASKLSQQSEDISDTLCQFLVECLPPSSQSKTATPEIIELCTIVESMIRPQVSYPHIFGFLEALVRLHGNAIDEVAKSQQHASTDGRVFGCLKSLLKALLVSIQPLLGGMWHTLPPKETQGNGQLPFESKASSPTQVRVTSNEALPNVLSFFNLCCERCPVFLLSLEDSAPNATSALDLSQCVLRATVSSIESMVEADVETSRSSLLFLTSLCDVATQSTIDVIRSKAQEMLQFQESSFRIFGTLLMGMCGNMSPHTLEHASRLIFRMLQSTDGPSLLASAEYEPFAKNPTIRRVVLNHLRGVRSEAALFDFAKDLWIIQNGMEHDQASDAMMKFCRTYTTEATAAAS